MEVNMDQKQVEKLADILITRPGFKKILSGEIARQLKEFKPEKETAVLKTAVKREKATK